MDIRQLTYFVEVADQGTVTAAAKALHLSQPPLSTQIQLLEQELGCKLFDRGARHMQLTDAGRTLYTRARGILDLCTSVKSEMSDLRAGTAGTLRLGLASSVCEIFLTRWLKRYHAGHKRLRFELYEANTYQLLEKVRSNQVELAFVRAPFSAPDLNCISLRSEPFCAVGRPDYFSGTGDGAFGLEQLNQAPLLFYRRWEQILMEIFQNRGLHPRVFCVSDDARTTVSMAEAGFGVGVVPQSALPLRSAGLEQHVIDEVGLRSEICAVCRRDIYVSAAAKQFFECIQVRQDTKE